MDTLQQVTEKTANLPLADFNIWFSLIKIIIILALLIALIYGFLFFMKKYLYKNSGFKNSNRIKLIETFYLSPKSKIYLIKIGKKFLLVGDNGNNISYLKELGEDEIE